MGVLLHEIVEQLIFLLEPGDELLRRDRPNFLLLSHDVVEQVGQAGQQSLLRSFALL